MSRYGGYHPHEGYAADTAQPHGPARAAPIVPILSEHDGDEFNASMSSFGVGRVVPEDEDDAWYSRRDGRRVLARHMEADDAEWYQKKDDDKRRFKKGEDTWYMNKGDDTWHLQETDDDAAHEEDGQRRRAHEEDGRRRGAHGGCDDAEHMHMKDEKGDDTGHWKCDDTGRQHGRSDWPAPPAAPESDVQIWWLSSTRRVCSGHCSAPRPSPSSTHRPHPVGA